MDPNVPPSLPPYQVLPGFEPAPQTTDDLTHLRLLSIFHYVVGGLTMAFSCLFLIHVFVGISMLSHARWLENTAHDRPAVVEQVSPAPESATSPADEQAADATPHPHRQESEQVPGFVGYLFIGIGGTAVLLGWTTGALAIFSGISIGQRRRRTFSLIVAGVLCMFFPFGTAVGVFAFIVLMRPSVALLYQRAA